jgi:hypothetical protein
MWFGKGFGLKLIDCVAANQQWGYHEKEAVCCRGGYDAGDLRIVAAHSVR